MEQVKCALCGQGSPETVLVAKDYRYHLRHNSFNVVKCSSCGLIYLSPRPLRENLGELYPNEYYPREGTLQKIFKPFFQRSRSKVKTIASHKRTGKVLEIGCGDGDLLFCFKKSGFQTYGVDVSGAACSLARSKVGKNILNCEVTDCNFPSNYFDIVVLNHSFEHVGSPNECLDEIHRILKATGILFISVPNIECFQLRLWREKATILDIPRHLYFYSPKTLRMILRKCKFDVTKMSMPLFVFPPLDLLPMDKMQRLLNRKKVLFVTFPVLVPLSVLRTVFCSFLGAPEIEVIAQKPHKV